MARFIPILILFTLFLSAKTIQFSEEKYHEALDKSFRKEGNITFSEKSMVIQYKGKEEKLIYQENLLVIEREGKRKEIDLDTQPSLKMFFILFDAIYFERKEVLESYFKTKEENAVQKLNPKAMIASYIDSVIYKKSNQQLIFLEINLHSGDRIHIEELD